MKFYIPPQLKRLFIAFALFISLFLFMRHILKPATFGQIGFYRGESLVDNAAIPIHYAGQSACFDCHQDIEEMKKLNKHSLIRCETCHGPGAKHIESSEASDIVKPAGREFCGKCHMKNAGKQKDAIHQINLEEHNINKNCTECHNPHQPWKEKK